MTACIVMIHMALRRRLSCTSALREFKSRWSKQRTNHTIAQGAPPLFFLCDLPWAASDFALLDMQANIQEMAGKMPGLHELEDDSDFSDTLEDTTLDITSTRYTDECQRLMDINKALRNMG